MTAPPNNASSPEVFGGWNKQMHPQTHARSKTARVGQRDADTLTYNSDVKTGSNKSKRFVFNL